MHDSRKPAAGLSFGDWLVPTAVFAFCGVVTWFSFGLERANPIIVGHAMQPRAYPVFLMAITGVLGVLLTLQMLRQGHQARGHIPYQTYLTVAVTWLFYVIAISVDMFIGLAVAMFLMSLIWGERRVAVATSLAVVVPVLTFFLFDQVLGKRFPRGVLTNLYYGA